VPNISTQIAILGLGRRLQALTFDIEQPAMKSAAQAAVFESPKGQIGPAMRTGPAEQAVTPLIVTEDHKVFAQKPYRLDRPLSIEFVDQGRGLPVAPQHLPCRFTRTNAGKAIILFRAEHYDLRTFHA
jgi:hypothetical protein